MDYVQQLHKMKSSFFLSFFLSLFSLRRKETKWLGQAEEKLGLPWTGETWPNLIVTTFCVFAVSYMSHTQPCSLAHLERSGTSDMWAVSTSILLLFILFHSFLFVFFFHFVFLPFFLPLSSSISLYHTFLFVFPCNFIILFSI